MAKGLFIGPRGRCPCCEKSVPVRLGSMLGDVKKKKWKIVPDMLRDICMGFKKAVHGTDGTGLHCPVCASHIKRSREIYWIGFEGAVTGPFCRYCLYKQVREHFEGDDDGGLKDYPDVYAIRVNDEMSQFVARLGLPEVTDADLTPPEEVKDDSEAMF